MVISNEDMRIKKIKYLQGMIEELDDLIQNKKLYITVLTSCGGAFVLNTINFANLLKNYTGPNILGFASSMVSLACFAMDAIELKDLIDYNSAKKEINEELDELSNHCMNK